MITKEEGQQKALEICTKYGITVVEGIPQKPDNYKEVGDRMMIDCMGLSYAVGNALYDNVKNDHVRAMAGEVAVLKMLLTGILEHPTALEIFREPALRYA